MVRRILSQRGPLAPCIGGGEVGRGGGSIIDLRRWKTAPLHWMPIHTIAMDTYGLVAGVAHSATGIIPRLA